MIGNNGVIFENNQHESKHFDKLNRNITDEVFALTQEYVTNLEALNKDSTPIHVDEIATSIAKLYEKIRKVVDWQEDNVLRRRAIERILKRLLFAKDLRIPIYKQPEVDSLAETITTELVRGGHLPNDEVPKESISVVSKSLTKYQYFLTQSSRNSPLSIKKQANFYTFILEIAACEIEEILVKPIREYALLDAMTKMMESRINLSPTVGLTKNEKEQQIYIAVCRTLFNLDDAFIAYRLLNFRFPDWKDLSDEALPARLNEVIDFWNNLENILRHPLAKNFNRICDQNDTVFSLLNDFLEEAKNKPEKIIPTIEDRKKFKQKISQLYDKRYNTLKKRLFRLGIFSTLSVFLSNWFTFFIVEVPLAKFFYEEFSLFTAFIDFIIPTIVMFLLVMIIRAPSEKNREHVLKVVESFVYKGEKKKFYEIEIGKNREVLSKTFYVTIYLFMTLSVFTVVGASFYVAGLPLTSVIFDTFTISLTVFAAVGIRNKSKELNVDDKTSFYEFLLDMIFVPIANVGSFFASKWKEYNVFAILFNFIIETPFALVLDTIEGWSQFLKDNKASIR
jgi:hypothetical protein